MDIVYDRLSHGTTALLTLEQTKLLGLLLVELECDSQWNKDKWHDDGKSAIGPSPAVYQISFNERLSSQRANEGSGNERSAGEGKRESPVLQAGSIGNEDVQDVINCAVADVEQYVTSCVAIGTSAGGKDDDADNVNDDEDKQALSTTPQVEGFGNWQLQNTSNDVGENVSGGNLRSAGEAGVCSVKAVESDCGLEGEHEEANPDPRYQVRT